MPVSWVTAVGSACRRAWREWP